MRTLKKTLSLVLALVLCFGLVGTAFAGNFDKYTDAADLGAVYAEAADVMLGTGIISGMSATELGATGTLTREQAAKIVAYLALGKTLADAATAEAAPFDDVAADRWSAGYISYCAEKGILAGYGDGNFGPADELTGYQFAKMLLAAMGYGKKDEFNPKSWALNTGIMAFDLKLFAGDVSAATHDPITRQQAMLMAFNAMGKPVQNYIELFDSYSASGKTLGETFNVVPNSVIRDDGLRYTYYSVNGKPITGDHLKDTLVATYPAGTTYKAIAAALGITAASTDTADYVVNGVEKATITLKDYIADNTKIPAGATLAVYKNAVATEAGEDDYKFMVTVSYLAKATVTKNAAPNAAYDDVTFTVYAASNYNVVLTEAAKIPTGTYTNNAYYVVVPHGDNSGATKMLSVVAPTTVEGKITGTGTGYVRIGETKYPTTAWTEALSGVAYNSTVYVGYLNAAGELLGYTAKVNAPVVATYDGALYLTAAQYQMVLAGADLYNAAAYTATAKAKVYFAGEAEAKVVDLAVYTKTNATTGLYDSTYVGKDAYGIAITTNNGVTTNIPGMTEGWYLYNATATGYVLTAVTENVAGNVVLQANKADVIANKYADANTVVTVYNYDNTTKATTKTTYTGIAGYPAAAKTYTNDASVIVAVTYGKDASNNDTNLVKTIDIYSAAASASTTPVNYARFKGNGEQYAASKYFQGFYVGGEYVEYKLAEDYASGALTEGAVYNITLNAKGELQAASTTGISMINNCTVNYVADTFIVLTNGTTPYYLTSTCAIYNVATGHSGEVDTLEVGDKISIDLVDTGVDTGKIAVIYITTEAVVA